MTEDRPRSSDFVQSLERGLAVIRAFDAEHRELALSDVARATGLTRAAARRFLLTLVKLGYVHFAGGRFSLRPRVLDLGYAYLASLSLPEVAQPHMEALVAKVNESSSISVLDDTEVVYVVRVPTRRIMSITLAVGTRLPAYATSMGRVLLAALPERQLKSYLDNVRLAPLTTRTIVDPSALEAELVRVRQQGFAMVDGEREEGVRSAAAPVRGSSGDVLAAINVSANAARISVPDLRDRCVPRLVETAEAISRDLGFIGPH
jgi:IclR family transcriptional regulator, pca regulon regulatory protein